MSKLHRLSRALRGETTLSIIKVQIAVPVQGSVADTMAQIEPFVRQVERRLAEHLGPDWAAPQPATPAQHAREGV
jgi:hypothetical protein